MELKIYNPQENGFLQQIDWNFEELKQEITGKAETYKNLVYSDEQMREAKKDRAKLRKLNSALNEKKKEIKNQIMAPYMGFENQIKELMGIVNDAVDNIDLQVKGYEEGLRQEKLEKIKTIYNETIGDLDRIIPFEKLLKPEYTNATTTLKSIREEMSATVQRVDTELKLINSESGKFVFEMKEAYLKNLDMNEALRTKQQLEETERRKAEFEAMTRQIEEEEKARRQQEVNQVIEAGREKEEKQEQLANPKQETQAESKKGENLRVLSITFKVTANEKQFSEVNRILAELQRNCIGLEIMNKEEK